MTRSGPLLTSEKIEEISDLLGELRADAWLLYDFHDRNPLAHRILGLGRTTRPAYALIPRVGLPVLLRHAIEASPWSRWPWESREYRGWRDLAVRLGELVGTAGTVAMETSRGGLLPAIDRVPSGVVDLVESVGTQVVSSADLITAIHSRWSAREFELHQRAAEAVRGIAQQAFRRAAAEASGSTPVLEVELMEWIRGELRASGLTDQEDCIVAVGAHTSDPHYLPSGHGAPLSANSIVLIDLWGRDPEGGVPADQTWMGFLGSRPPDRVLGLWSAVREARDAAIAFLAERAASRRPVRGWEVDRVARNVLADRDLDGYFIHRLGHSIDAQLHGSGPNLDDLETRDERRLLTGVGFSVEPGVYIPGELGVRSEVNVYWGADGPSVTPREIQEDLLVAPDL